VAVEAITHHIAAPAPLVAYSVTLPVAVVLVLVWALHAPLVPRSRGQAAAVFAAAAVTLAIAAMAGLGLPLSSVVLLTCAPVASLVALGVIDQHSKAATA
jgi:hypothetical protein